MSCSEACTEYQWQETGEYDLFKFMIFIKGYAHLYILCNCFILLLKHE